MSLIVTDVYHRGLNERSHEIDTSTIDYVTFDRYLGCLEIFFLNGNMSGSRISNFSLRDLRILERFERDIV